MRTRPTPRLILGLILASSFFLRTDSPVFAQPATVSPAAETLVPYQGLHDSGVTIMPPGIDEFDTTVPISDPARLKVGQIVETQDASVEIMEITGLGSGTMDVTRGAFGTAPAAHNSGTVLWADFTEVDVLVSDVSYRDTGATLTVALDATSLGDSAAFPTESIDLSETSIEISDATLLNDATAVHFNGASFVSPVTANTSFLQGTGHVSWCFETAPRKGNSLSYGCATGCPGEPPCGDGPNGSTWLAEVRLVADGEGTISLDLLDPPTAKLIEFDEYATLLPISEVVDGSVTVVSGSPPPPPAPGTDCGGGIDIKMCVQPPTQTVGVGTEFSVYVVAQNVTNFGGFEFKLEWDPAKEEMTVDNVVRGYLKDDGTCCSTGGGNIWLYDPLGIDATATDIEVNDTIDLQPGWTVVIQEGVGWQYGDEEMLIVGVSPGAPGTITVVRGYNGTTPASHPYGKAVFAGPERMFVQRATYPSPYDAGTGFRADLPVLRVSDHTLLSASAVQIDNEWFKLLEVPARTLHDTGLAIDTGGVNETDPLPVTGAGGPLQKGWTLKVDDEFMVVTEDQTSGTVQVARGLFGSVAASHSGGTPISAIFLEPNTAKTSGGFQGTPVESHAIGAAITDVDGLGDFGFTMTKSLAGDDIVDFVWAEDGPFPGQTGRTVACDPPTLGSDNIMLACNSGSASLPLGPAGSGTLATVNVTATALLPMAPWQTLTVSGVTMHDITGDSLAVGGGGTGTVRVVGCPDFDNPAEGHFKDGQVDFVGDVLDVARAAFIPGYTQVPGHDVDLNGSVDFVGDVIITAKIALGGDPPHCPP